MGGGVEVFLGAPFGSAFYRVIGLELARDRGWLRLLLAGLVRIGKRLGFSARIALTFWHWGWAVFIHPNLI